MEKIFGLDMVLAVEKIALSKRSRVGLQRKMENLLKMKVDMERDMVIFHKFFGKPLQELDAQQHNVKNGLMSYAITILLAIIEEHKPLHTNDIHLIFFPKFQLEINIL